MSWFEKRSPISDKAPEHQAVAAKKEFDKEFTNRTEIVPKVTLHLTIPERDFVKFMEVLRKFSVEHNNIIKVEIDKENVNLEIPKNDLLDFVRVFESKKGFELNEVELAEIKQLMEVN